MIFQRTYQLILDGRKTQTRRAIKLEDRAMYGADGRVIAIENRNSAGRPFMRYRVGARYAVQPGRGRDAVGRIELLEIRHCDRAGVINDQDARAEGFESADEFRRTYSAINGAAALDEPCWALTFRRVEA